MRPIVVLLTAALLTTGHRTGAQGDLPSFKGGVERVAVAAIVRDTKGKLVRNLGLRDFELIDSGHSRPLIGVWSEPSPASVAILMDASGSMATKTDRAREAAQALIAGLKPGVDEAALYSFDTALKELRPFSTNMQNSAAAWEATTAYGATSLWDVVAQTAREISARQQRRALVVITDGVDSASRLKPSEVASIASSVDVPVYILVIAPSSAEDPARDAEGVRGPLADFATWTGGDSQVVRDTVTAWEATTKILTELQHQYVVAFEPGAAPGWHSLVIRTRKEGLFVRARSGYMVVR